MRTGIQSIENETIKFCVLSCKIAFESVYVAPTVPTKIIRGGSSTENGLWRSNLAQDGGNNNGPDDMATTQTINCPKANNETYHRML